MIRADRLESLASPAFLAALALLVVNDVALKPLFHNALTGKLSDFAGLFALTLFVVTLWPRQARWIGVFVAAAFALWKTSYAGPLIESLNAVSPIAFGRTVDLTDLAAVPMIPFALWAAPRLGPLPLPRALQLALVVVALVAFTATSRARYVARDTMDITQASVDELAIRTLFDEIADERALRCEVCGPIAEGRVYVAEQYGDVQAVIVDLDAPQTLSFTVSGWDRRRGVRSLARRIRGELEERFPDIAVIDTTSDVWVAARGATTFVVRVPASNTSEDAKQALSSIVDSVARDHHLEADAGSSGYYARSVAFSSPDFVVAPVLPRRGPLLVRLTTRSENTEMLYRAVSDDLATRLGAEFGADNVTTHNVSAPPPQLVLY